MSTLRKSTLAFCFLLLVLPLIQFLFPVVDMGKLNENRVLSPKPAGNPLIEIFVQGDAYSRAYEKYFNDHFGFREFLIKLKNQLDYSLFGLADSLSDEVIIGKDGYLFYRSVVEVEQPHSDRLTDTQIMHAVGHFSKLQASLKQRGAELIVVPIELKNQIYPEKFPDTGITRKKPNSFDRLLTKLKELPGLIIIETTPILLEAKKNKPVYYKTDFHWNDYGAYVVGKAVIEKINQRSGQAAPDNYLLTFKQIEFSGGQNNSLAIFFPPKEIAWIMDQSSLKSSIILNDDTRFNGHWKSQDKTNPALLPLTLVVGNSFAETFTKIAFYDNFSEAYWLHSNHKKYLLDYLPPGTKYVVYQYIDGDIGYRVVSDEYWPK